MRIKHKVNVRISEDAEGKNKLLAGDDVAAEVTIDGMKELSTGTLTVTAGEPFTVPMGGITDGRGFFLKASGDCTVTINGGPQLEMRLAAKEAASATTAVFADECKAFLECAVDDLVVEVGDGDPDITLTYAVWGDPIEGG